jgi:hypothetical protein
VGQLEEPTCCVYGIDRSKEETDCRKRKEGEESFRGREGCQQNEPQAVGTVVDLVSRVLSR